MTVDINEQLKIYSYSFAKNTVPTRSKCRTIAVNTLKEHLETNKTLELSFDDYGKPYLKDYSQLSFSYAHSRTKLVIVVYPNAKNVGVDTEPMDRLYDLYELRKSAFSKSENNTLTLKEYVIAWCRKEAAVKQLGRGFREADPSEFTVSIEGVSYKLYLRGYEIQKGYFTTVAIDDAIVVVCADKPIGDILLDRRVLGSFKTKVKQMEE
ncbi:MAG: 4'-phosphopantetheinyl transferase superfamily protein [Patescibacteria group bacterium]